MTRNTIGKSKVFNLFYCTQCEAMSEHAAIKAQCACGLGMTVVGFVEVNAIAVDPQAGVIKSTSQTGGTEGSKQEQ